MALWPPAPLPKSPLGFYRLLGPKCGLRVSPICLGAMNFGDGWKHQMGLCSKETTYEILDYFKSKGGNFAWLGDWMEARNCREQMVVATKYTTNYQLYKGTDEIIQANYGGNSMKSMRVSVDASLKKLKTDYIDILYVHWWSYDTPIEEIMHGLNDLVVQGKVLYLGISDTPAWIVSRANTYARALGLRPFVVYQGNWSAAQRSFEREIIPMARAEGMALAPWGVLGGGLFKTEEQLKQQEGRKGRTPSEAQKKVSKALEEIAKSKGTIMTSVAFAYVIYKYPYVFPICGGRNVKHLEGNIAALELKLSKEDIKAIESAVPFDRGFPYSMLNPQLDDMAEYVLSQKRTGPGPHDKAVPMQHHFAP
ncbi:Aldo/keto reductase [Rhizodiscina lignyota]|uniref:Aldo/keto reductase n=1 Tax=Rhizodiscina lignyota TaxID=1504668 RepID=A0A9P4ILA3_9PEZI|nr:Aldo/keto reductase [Rhizodiscina lignyota]